VRVIGVNLDAIRRGEDRETFEDMMRLGIETARSEIATTVEEAMSVPVLRSAEGFPIGMKCC
jgi:carbamoyl-phosphate synthase large subunit